MEQNRPTVESKRKKEKKDGKRERERKRRRSTRIRRQEQEGEKKECEHPVAYPRGSHKIVLEHRPERKGSTSAREKWP